MGKFDEFTKNLSDEHQIKDEEHREQQKRDRDKLESGWLAERKVLEAQVTPLVKEAASACEGLGLRPLFSHNWERDLFTSPQIEFQLFGPKKRSHDDGVYEIEAHKMVCRVEDGKVRSSISKRAYKSRVGIGYIGYGIEGTEQAIKYVIASYYDEIDPKNI